MTELTLPTKEAIDRAGGLIRKGELVAFPTETVYGLGANALDEAAVRKIFAAKGRPADNPLIVHVPELTLAKPLCEITPSARELAKRFWPGPMTLLMKKKPTVPDVVTAGLPSVAIRIPSHPVARAFMAAADRPIAAPSANTSGKPSPTTAQHVLDDMNGRIPMIIEGGACQVGLESTVLDLTQAVPTVLRPGGITPEMLLTVLDEVRVADSVLRPLAAGEKALSPGMRYRHYAPKGKLWLVKGSDEHVLSRLQALYDLAAAQGHNARILCFSEHLEAMGQRRCACIGRRSEPTTVAAELFKVLRQMDDENVDVLYSEALEPSGIGLAVMNRLSRAAAFQSIDADQE